VQKELKDLASLAQKKIKKEAFGKKKMDKEVYTKAVNGNMDYFLKENEENQDTMKFLSQVAPDGSNILHIAIQHEELEFAKLSLKDLFLFLHSTLHEGGISILFILNFLFHLIIPPRSSFQSSGTTPRDA